MLIERIRKKSELFFAIIVFLDATTKAWALIALSSGVWKINRFLSFELVFNRGISFSLFSSTQKMMQYGVSIGVACILLLFAWFALTRKKRGHCVVFESMVIAGGLSNFLNRIMMGFVIDFIKITVNGFVFPLFNVADMVICCGIAMMVFHIVRGDYD